MAQSTQLVVFSLILIFSSAANIFAMTYDSSRPLISYKKDRRHTWNIDARTETSIFVGKNDKGDCIKTTAKELHNLRAHDPKVSHKKVADELCIRISPATEVLIKDKKCDNTGRFVIKSNEFKGTYGTSESQTLVLNEDCSCLQLRKVQVFSRLRSWINPFNIFQGPAYTFTSEVRACSFAQTYELWKETNQLGVIFPSAPSNTEIKEIAPSPEE